MAKKTKLKTKEEPKKATKAKAVEHNARVEGHVDHPAHPKCPECGRAMFKWMGVNSEYANKTPKKEDPWAYCRNKACSLFGEDQSESTPKKAKKEDKGEEVTKKSKPKEKGLDEELEGFGADDEIDAIDEDDEDDEGDEDDDEIDAIDDNDEDDEGEEVVQDEDGDEEDEVDDDAAQIALANCRKRIVKAIRKGGNKAKDAIQLALSVLHGETSIKQVNEMIDEFDLEDEYGLKKK